MFKNEIKYQENFLGGGEGQGDPPTSRCPPGGVSPTLNNARGGEGKPVSGGGEGRGDGWWMLNTTMGSCCEAGGRYPASARSCLGGGALPTLKRSRASARFFFGGWVT